MIRSTRCTVCGKRGTDLETITCDTCGGSLHAPCREYYQTFDCRTCGDETWIGDLEL